MSKKIYTNDIDDEMVEILKEDEDEDVIKYYFEEAYRDTYIKVKRENSFQYLTMIENLIKIINKFDWGEIKINDTVKLEALLCAETKDKYIFELNNTNGVLCDENEKRNLPHRKMRTLSSGFQETSAEPINKNDSTFYINLKCRKYPKPQFYEYYGKIILVIPKADNTYNEWYNNNFMKNITLYLQE